MFRRSLLVCLLVLLFRIAFAAAQELTKVRMGYPSLGFQAGPYLGCQRRRTVCAVRARCGTGFPLRRTIWQSKLLAAGDPPLMSIGQVVAVQGNLSGIQP